MKEKPDIFEFMLFILMKYTFLAVNIEILSRKTSAFIRHHIHSEILLTPVLKQKKSHLVYQGQQRG